MKIKRSRLDSNAISLLVLVIALSLSVILIGRKTGWVTKASTQTETFSWQLNAGRSLISPPIATNLSARRFCELNPFLSSVAKANDGSDPLTWSEYNCLDPNRSQNFRLQGNKSYTIVATQPFTLTMSGKTISLPIDYGFLLGWNSFGINIADQHTLTAEQLCGPLVDSDYQLVQTGKLQNGTWSLHFCTDYYHMPNINDFPIVKGEGYIAKIAPIN